MKNIDVSISFEAENEDELFDFFKRIGGDKITVTGGEGGGSQLVGGPAAVADVLKEAAELAPEARKVVDAFMAPPAPTPDPIIETPEPVAVETVAAPAPVAAEGTPAPAATNGVEVDKNGLPWDARINPPSKLKLKKEGTWKLKRGLDPAIVKQVQDELRATMAIPSASPETPAPTPQETPVVTTQAPPAPAPAPTPQETPAATGGPVVVTTFPEFMQEITKRGLDDATVLAAVKSVGLQSPALVAARPDLIPAICAVLFV